MHVGVLSIGLSVWSVKYYTLSTQYMLYIIELYVYDSNYSSLLHHRPTYAGTCILEYSPLRAGAYSLIDTQLHERVWQRENRTKMTLHICIYS